VGKQMEALGGRVRKVGRYLHNRAPGLGRYLCHGWGGHQVLDRGIKYLRA